MPASNEMRIKSLIRQGFAMPPDDVSGDIFARKSVAAGQGGRAAGELGGGEAPASNEMHVKSLIRQGFAMPPDNRPGAFCACVYFFTPQT